MDQGVVLKCSNKESNFLPILNKKLLTDLMWNVCERERERERQIRDDSKVSGLAN